LLAYGNSLHGVFLFDDMNSIVDNPHIRTLWPLREPLSAPPDASIVRRPVVGLSLAVNYAFGGLDVRGYHVFNLAVHILSTLLLFGLIERSLRAPSLRGRFATRERALAAASALLWTVHPLLTDSVDYVVQRSELLWAFFFLLTLTCAARGASSPRAGRWYVAAGASCAAGMASKEVMIVAPLLVLLYDRTFLSGSFRAALRDRAGLYAGLAGTWLLLAALMVFTPFEHLVGFGFRAYTPFHHALTQSGVILHYLRLAFWPTPLVLDYDGWPIARGLADALPNVAVVLSLLALTLWALRRRPALGFLGACFFLILAPSSSVLPTPTEIVAERRMYLPLAAVVMLSVLAAHEALARPAGQARLPRTPRSPRPVDLAVVGAAVVIVSVFLGRATRARNEDYDDAVHMWQDVIAKRPDCPGAHANLGFLLVERGEPERSLAHSAEALRLRPGWSLVHVNLGLAQQALGRREDATASFREAVRLRPGWAKAHYLLAKALGEGGRVEEAIAQLEEVVKLDPGSAQARNSLGSLLAAQGRRAEAIEHLREAVRLAPESSEMRYNLGLALVGEGRLEEGTACFVEAIRLNADNAEAHNALALALARAGRIEDALAHAREAAWLKPDTPAAHRTLSLLLERAGRNAEAIDHYREVARLFPESVEAMNNLAWALATSPDPSLRNGEEAVRLAGAASAKAGRDDPDLMDTLAAAYAAAGRFGDAVSTAERALATARAAGKEDLAREIEGRVALYRAGRAFSVAPKPNEP
jgi:tetratricopeptide (TPR) repeat protein